MHKFCSHRKIDDFWILTNNRVTIMWYTILIDNFNRYDKFIVFWIEMDRSFSMFLFSKILLTDPSIPILGCRCYNGRNNIAETVSRIYTLHARNGKTTKSLLCSFILYRVSFCFEDSPISGFATIELFDFKRKVYSYLVPVFFFISKQNFSYWLITIMQYENWH